MNVLQQSIKLQLQH